MARLALVLKVSKEALLGRHPPIMAAFYDDSAPEALQYYGEVAIHFHGGGEALLLSISEEARDRIWENLTTSKFVIVKDLGNRTVVIRKAAISDLYFSSEAYDDFGPEHHETGYEPGTPVQLPDPRDWEIIHCLACDDDEGLEEFASEDVERVKELVLVPPDEHYEKLVADWAEGREQFGREIKPEDVEEEKRKATKHRDAIFELSTDLIYQLSNGKQRHVSIIECSEDSLYEAFGYLVDDDLRDSFDEGHVILQNVGYHRATFINLDAVDYISIPTHLLEKSTDDVDAEVLDDIGDDLDDEDDKPQPPPSKRKGKKQKTSAE
jgi:hypothetical protein